VCSNSSRTSFRDLKPGSASDAIAVRRQTLVALLDQAHTFHERAHACWSGNHQSGWASCPIVENGVVRINRT
jgi:hypothetical protein